MNKVILIGRLTKDPELRKTQMGLSVCNFTLAVTRPVAKGEEPKTDFINCIVWRNQADNLAKYQRKGNLIAIEGSIQTGTYDDPNGVRKYTVDIVANNISFLESNKKTENSYEVKEQQYQQANEQWKQQAFPNTNADISSADLPF